MKQFFLGLFIDSFIDTAIKALDEMAKRTESQVDDQMVDIIISEKSAIAEQIKKSL